MDMSHKRTPILIRESARSGSGSGVVSLDVKPSELASVQLPDGQTYTFFYDQGTNPPTLKYLSGPLDDATYLCLPVSCVGASASVTNNSPSALTAALLGDNIHVFYADKDLVIQHIALNLATKTWKVSTFVDKATIAPSTGIAAVGSPVLKVHYVDVNNQKTITEAYLTEGSWTTRYLA